MPVWQALYEELESKGVTVVTVALDIDPEKARHWIEAAAPTHPSLIDSHHRIDELLGISNVPMAVWIDESGTLVRPAEAAAIKVSALRSIEITDDLAENLKLVLTEVKAMPDTGDAYRAAIVDWVEKGSDSEFALEPYEVIARSQPRPKQHSEAAACFAMGNHLFETEGKEAAIEWWKRAHALYPENWTYKRQAWTLETTPDGEPSDLLQEVDDAYGTSWIDSVLELGGGANYTVVPDL
ncbi:TlpA family protein disulfide reductase [Acidimicrobium ferrooxidans]|uniref:TlpA family protein disulfide reductase n=1 Tax=Acidimicrobium ferrooxidans TaxID=53635 RepID=A0ABS3AQ54_9ACTN|nr:TlpA family protein disulfide reductase [Acidimicrobium ferrooxidans]